MDDNRLKLKSYSFVLYESSYVEDLYITTRVGTSLSAVARFDAPLVR